MDFRPLFIALTLRRLDTVLNVDKQRNAALLSGGFRRLCPSARYPFPYGFLCIIRAEGFKTGEAFLSYEWLLAELPEEEKEAFCKTLDTLYWRSKQERRAGFVNVAKCVVEGAGEDETDI